MTDRMIDYYVKSLPFDARQEIFKAIDQINPSAVEKLLQKEEGYPIYRSLGYTDEKIARQLQKKALYFQLVNEVIVKYNRRPLFDNPTDTFESSKRYLEITQRRSKEELLQIMGCTWEEYIPENN